MLALFVGVSISCEALDKKKLQKCIAVSTITGGVLWLASLIRSKGQALSLPEILQPSAKISNNFNVQAPEHCQLRAILSNIPNVIIQEKDDAQDRLVECRAVQLSADGTHKKESQCQLTYLQSQHMIELVAATLPHACDKITEIHILFPKNTPLEVRANDGCQDQLSSMTPCQLHIEKPSAPVSVKNELGDTIIRSAGNVVHVLGANVVVHQCDGAIGDIDVKAPHIKIDNFAQNLCVEKLPDSQGVLATRNPLNEHGIVTEQFPYGCSRSQGAKAFPIYVTNS